MANGTALLRGDGVGKLNAPELVTQNVRYRIEVIDIPI
jgi:hypothetical protein